MFLFLGFLIVFVPRWSLGNEAQPQWAIPDHGIIRRVQSESLGGGNTCQLQVQVNFCTFGGVVVPSVDLIHLDHHTLQDNNKRYFTGWYLQRYTRLNYQGCQQSSW